MFEIEIDDFEVQKAFEKLYYITILNSFKKIFGEEEFKKRIKENALNKYELITYYDLEDTYYYDEYLSMNTVTFEFINIIFDSYDEKEICFQTYGELIEYVEKGDNQAIEFYEILTKHYLYDVESMEELLKSTLCLFTFYIDLVSQAAKILTKDNNSSNLNYLVTLLNYAFDSSYMVENELQAILVQKEDDNFYILVLGEPIAITNINSNIGSFYKLLSFCKDIIEGR